MYVHTSFPNNTFALDLNDPGTILWQDKPKQNPAARAVACCDLVNRGLAYWPGDGKTEPPRVSRRPFGLGQAAKAWTLAWA